MNSNVALIQAMIFAMAGWVATCYCLVHSRIRPQTRRLLVIPLWLVWMAAAIGGPVFQGVVSVSDALTTVLSLSLGMALVFVMRARNGRRSR